MTPNSPRGIICFALALMFIQAGLIFAGDDPCRAGGRPDAETPFTITVDGSPMVDDSKTGTAEERGCVDPALAKADIQIHYDSLQLSPALNAWSTVKGAARENEVRFFTYTNYALLLRKAEIRIFRKGQDTAQTPYAVMPVSIGGASSWQWPAEAPDDLFFVLRVYDEKDRFDETAAKPVVQPTQNKSQKESADKEPDELAGFGENSRKLANIPVHGGTITINGSKMTAGQTVSALGFPVPVDREGKFAFRQILLSGPHVVEVSVKDKNGRETVFRRSVSIADNDWFYVALADITLGRNSAVKPSELVADGTESYNKREYIEGRGAFYLKGLVKGEYLLTASADTRERRLADLFSNFDSKDPQYLLRRIDPDKFYPVYGDDSTIVDDAPTQGKFYVRLERGDSRVMWGNFQTSWTGTELTQYSRGLYGANLVWTSGSTTQYGEKRATVNGFAAEPGTLSSREEFRGTGGSLYYLHNLDITQGSERLWIEIRDKDSEIAVERRQLTPVEDYDIDYIQGRIMLRAPLSSTADGSTLVRTASIDGDPAYLIVTYEYVPGLNKLSGLATGGQAGVWVSDHLHFGASVYSQGDDQVKQKLGGADIIARYKPGTFVKAEIARSEGSGNGMLSSISGGFDFNQSLTSGDRASAWYLVGAVDFGELWKGSNGRATAYWKERERGFSAPGQIADTGEAVSQMGMTAQTPFGKSMLIGLKADRFDADSQTRTSAETSVKKNLTSEFAASIGVRYDDRNVRMANASRNLSRSGSRTDAIARIDYTPVVRGAKAAGGSDAKPSHKSWGLYGFLQGTVARTEDRNRYDRAGLGATWQASRYFKLGIEASDGYGGLGGKVSGDYAINQRSSVYLSYQMESELPDAENRGEMGTGVFGSKYKFSERLGVFGETRIANGYTSSLMHSFGLDLASRKRWTYGLKYETGTLSDQNAGDIKRHAVGLSTTYKFEKTKYAGAVEYRNDSGTEDRTAWLVRNSFAYQANPSWRLLGKFNLSSSDSSAGSFYSGDFVEGVFGAAYRPVNGDKWNSLFKYTYYYNLPSAGQKTATNPVADYIQKSHVISFDAIYDLAHWLSLGGKYGLRLGDLQQSRVDGGDWFSSRAQIYIVRADFHVIRNWDATIEGRRLYAKEAGDARSGALAAIYRHIGENVKVGIGYNFTNFSDDLTDLSYRSHGVFLNVIGGF